MKKLCLFFLVFVLFGCTSIKPVHIRRHASFDSKGTYLVFPFTSPVSRDGKVVKGLGDNFTTHFITACKDEDLNVRLVNVRRFTSSRPIDPKEALEYASGTDANFIITGEVTRWVDYWDNYGSDSADLAGFKIEVLGVFSKRRSFTGEVVAKSGSLWRGSPREFIPGLAEEMVEVLLKE